MRQVFGILFYLAAIGIIAVLCMCLSCTQHGVREPTETLVCADEEETTVNQTREGITVQTRETVCHTWMTPHGLFRTDVPRAETIPERAPPAKKSAYRARPELEL